MPQGQTDLEDLNPLNTNDVLGLDPDTIRQHQINTTIQNNPSILDQMCLSKIIEAEPALETTVFSPR